VSPTISTCPTLAVGRNSLLGLRKLSACHDALATNAAARAGVATGNAHRRLPASGKSAPAANCKSPGADRRGSIVELHSWPG
jgi:hypothetical protein